MVVTDAVSYTEDRLEGTIVSYVTANCVTGAYTTFLGEVGNLFE